MGKKRYLAADEVFPFVATFIDESLGFVGKYDLTRMSALYANRTGKLLFDHSKAAWTAGELKRLRWKTSMLKTIAERAAAPLDKSGLLTMIFHFANHVVEVFGRCGSLLNLKLGPSEHFNVLMEQSHRMTFGQYSTRTYDTVQKNEQNTRECAERADTDTKSCCWRIPIGDEVVSRIWGGTTCAGWSVPVTGAAGKSR